MSRSTLGLLVGLVLGYAAIFGGFGDMLIAIGQCFLFVIQS